MSTTLVIGFWVAYSAASHELRSFASASASATFLFSCGYKAKRLMQRMLSTEGA